MKRSKQSNEILDIVKASECVSMGGYGLIELALRELDEKISQYESNKYYIELGKAVKKAFEEGFTVIKGCYGSCDKELCFDEQLLEWAEGRE